MARRPVFIPRFDGHGLVEEKSFEFRWAPGFAATQKQKNVRALHEKARAAGLAHILEISSKSDDAVGRRLSAFSLQIELAGSVCPLESVCQGAKVFARSGGPFPDIQTWAPREARRFVRADQDEAVTGFELEGKGYPLEPRTAFYDWLYIRSLVDHAEWIAETVDFDAFTDIEFNLRTQINCQARAFAEVRSLRARPEDGSVLRKAAADWGHFVSLLPAGPQARPPAPPLPLFDRCADHGFA